MTKRNENLGGRLPLVDPATFTAAQRELYDTLQGSWMVYAKKLGVQAMTEDGRLIGPFNTFLLHPEITTKLSEFQAAEQKYTTLPQRIRELVILTVGVVWNAAYELYAQAPTARNTGLPDDTIRTLLDDGVPENLSEHEKLAVRLTRELATRHHIPDELYRQAEEAFGRTGLFDIVAVMGVYETVCTLMTLFEVPAPSAAVSPS